MQTSLVAPSTSFAVGDRVRYHIPGSPVAPRTGRIMALQAQGSELYGKMHVESGGAQWLSVGGMTPAPTIASQLDGYHVVEINAALHQLVLDDLSRATKKHVSEVSGVSTTEITKWLRTRRIPVDRLQQLADIFEISARLVRSKIDETREYNTELAEIEARAQSSMQAEAEEARRADASAAPKPWEMLCSPESMAAYIAHMQAAERI